MPRPLPSAYHTPEMFERIGGLAVLEQKMLASRDLNVCVDCDAPGTVKQERGDYSLVKSVPHYWFCDECDAYWKAKS